MPKKLSYRQKQTKKGINLLTKWAENKGYDVKFEGNQIDEVRRIHKEINICIREPLESQLFGLAHECGHVMIEHNLKRFKEKYPRNYEWEIEGNKTRRWSKISLHQEIAEECEAWQKAQNLMERLNISYDRDKFDKVSADCIFTYIEQAVG